MHLGTYFDALGPRPSPFSSNRSVRACQRVDMILMQRLCGNGNANNEERLSGVEQGRWQANIASVAAAAAASPMFQSDFVQELPRRVSPRDLMISASQR
jgi:hypothetical protein